jgi:hypothetical protein
MKRGVSILSVLSLAVAMAMLATPLQAQHLHAHGNHFDVHQNVPHGHDAAGHLVDRFGHHIDGDGHHTGAIGVYENGSTNFPYSSRWSGYYPSYSAYPYFASPYYSSSLYSSSYYGSPLYSAPRYLAPSIIAPRILPSAPPLNAPAVVAGNAVRNKIPVPPAAGRGGAFVLTNPADSGGPIRYSLNSFDYTINPGESQTVPLDRDWVISFDNGMSKTVTYRMEDGLYEFTVSPQTGWNLVKRTAAAAPLNPLPVPPGRPGRRSL